MMRVLAPVVALAAAAALIGCAEAAPVGVSDEARSVVEAAIVDELVPEQASAEAVDGMSAIAEDMAAAIIDDDRCGSAAYESGLGGAPLLDAHRAGCAAAEGLGIL